jgi:hypothetical protein
MLLNAALLLLIRSACAALLMLLDVKYYFWYLAGDIGFYLAQKTVRGDFHYWVPLEGKVELVSSFLARVLVKVTSDFTGIVQLRHPGELGGFYWTSNIFMAFTASFVIAKVYFMKSASPVVEEGPVFSVLSYLAGAWAVTFCVFLFLMRKEYRATFFSAKLGKEVTMDYFWEDSDESKALVLTSNKKQWKEIEPAVKQWIQENWLTWEAEQPAWFDDVFKSRVDDDWIISSEARLEKMQGAGAARKRSVLFVRALSSKRNSAVIAPLDPQDTPLSSRPRAIIEEA